MSFQRFPHGRPILCHAASSGRPDATGLEPGESCRRVHFTTKRYASNSLEAIISRLEAIAIRVEARPLRLLSLLGRRPSVLGCEMVAKALEVSRDLRVHPIQAGASAIFRGFCELVLSLLN